jgi:hypothetical protein
MIYKDKRGNHNTKMKAKSNPTKERINILITKPKPTDSGPYTASKFITTTQPNMYIK